MQPQTIPFDKPNQPATIPFDSKPTTPPQQSISDKIWGSIATSAKGGVNEIVQAQKSSMAGTENPLRAGVDMASGLASVVTSPLAPVMQPVSDALNKSFTGQENSGLVGDVMKYITNHPLYQKFALSKAGEITSNVADVTGKLANVAGTVVGATDLITKAPAIGTAIKNAPESIINTADKLRTGISEKIGGTPQDIAIKQLKTSIDATMPLPDKNVRIDTLRNSLPESGKGTGGVSREGILGKSTINATPEDIARGTVANEYIKGISDPVKQIQNVNKGIIIESNGTNTFLDQHSTPANFEDMRGYIEANNKPPVNITKDTTAFEAYNRSNENALNTLYKTMKDTASSKGDFGATTPGSDIRNARIAVDQQITNELGQEVFGSPQYKGIKAAEVNVRNVMNRMGEDMLRYPGQLEQLNKYNEFLSQLNQKDIKITPEYETQLKEKFGLKSTPESEANAQRLSDQQKKMSLLYDARDNMIDNYQKKVGQNKVQEAIAKNPVIKAGVGMAKKVIPFGIGSHL